jgi:AcrR family transcriptional regulator
MKKRITRRQRQRDNRVRLLAAAEKVFAERGIQGASLDMVAAEAGLTKGAVYSNFHGKNDLVVAVMRHRLREEAEDQAEHRLSPDRPAGHLVTAFGDYWAARLRRGDRDVFIRVVLEFVLHGLRQPGAGRALRALLFPPTRAARHPLVPVGSEAARLPPEHQDAILKALDLGMGVLSTLAPERCPPELFGQALRLLTGMEIDESLPANLAGNGRPHERDDRRRGENPPVGES